MAGVGRTSLEVTRQGWSCAHRFEFFGEFDIVGVVFFADVPVEIAGVTGGEGTARTLVGLVACVSHHVCLK